jgi:uncharacterized protein (DUF1800 family)
MPIAPPSSYVVALNRLAFGPAPGDVGRLTEMGLGAWVDEQLAPSEDADRDCAARLAAARLHIEYEGGKDEQGRTWKGCKEDRPLRALAAPLAELWKLTRDQNDEHAAPVPYEEKVRPLQEVRAATWLRAVYSKWQLREVLVDFWHNHFNVNAGIDDERVAITFPVYDREVIRRHCLGNFRQFLEAVATSVPMLLYLNNARSKASPANENYARELFELHTLGAGHYFNHLYNRWRDVPGALEGKPVGYIDQDVYEAARAFTGWTLGDGSETSRGDRLPNTGAFYYYDGWHDPYQKRVLASEFDPNQPAMADGRRVLDLVAAHPATATHVCTKLCRRLVADDPPESVIQKAVEAWGASIERPDQIAHVVRAIVMSEEFRATWGRKLKRPFDAAISFLRATGAEVRPSDDLFDLTERMGQRLFGWPTPAGHPDRGEYWSGTNVMLGRWNGPLSMLDDDFGATRFRLARQTPPEARTPRQIVAHWTERMLGRPLAGEKTQALLRYVARERKPDEPLSLSERQFVERINGLVALLAMSPEFHLC